MYDVLSSRKKKLKRFPSLKFCHSKSEIFRPPLLESGSSWARYFHSSSYTCVVIYWSLDFRGISVGFWLSAKCLLIQKLNLGKICLKAEVKVAPNLQRLASAGQVKISNHTMIVPSQLPPKKKLPSCTLNKLLHRGRRAWGHASESICWRDRSIRLVFYLVSSSRFFLLLSMRRFL